MEMDRVKIWEGKKEEVASKSGERRGKARMRYRKRRTKEMLQGCLVTSVRRRSNQRNGEFVNVEASRMKPMQTTKVVRKAARRCHHPQMSICLSRQAKMSGMSIFVRT